MARLPISACVSCRNDEVTIRRWLDIFAPRVQEIIVVDTDSQDATLEIIARAPYDNIVVHERNWPGFVEARNRFFDLATQPYLLQVDTDELLLERFFERVPGYLAELETGQDSIRLPHVVARFDYTSMADVERRACEGDKYFNDWSYPRDILYRRDVAARGIRWTQHGGAEILNNLDTEAFVLADDQLIHCIPREHRLNHEEYHARKMLAYANDLGYRLREWDALLVRFDVARLQQMFLDTDADPDDLAPHATWWGQVGQYQPAHPPSLLEDADIPWVIQQWDAGEAGLAMARALAVRRGLSLTAACRQVTVIRQRLDLLESTIPAIEPDAFQVSTAWRDQAGYYREMITDTEASGIRTIVELGVHWGYSLLTLAQDFPRASVIGVDNLSYDNADEAVAHLARHLPEFTNARLIVADTSAVGLAWHHPWVYQPVDLLNIDADHSYEGVRADFEAWVDHVRPGGAVLFHDVQAFPDTVGRFFAELDGGDKMARGNLGVWIKPDHAVLPQRDALQVLQAALTGCSEPDDTLSRDELLERFEGKSIRFDHRAMTMTGAIRLADLKRCVEQVLQDRIPGDFIETGVWRGGSAILMRALLEHDQAHGRSVWLADSFAGVPAPDDKHYPHDRGSSLHEMDMLAVSLDQVKANFEHFGLLDDQVQFLPGWFRDTLADTLIEQLAILRLDGDLYESTMLALTYLYPKLVPGGYVIVDDYYVLEPCRRAVDDYRAMHGIREPMRRIDWTCVRWRRGREFQETPILG